MTAGLLSGAVASSDPFGLWVGSKQVLHTGDVRVLSGPDFPLRIVESGEEGAGVLSFTIEDPTEAFSVKDGIYVHLIDFRNSATRFLFKGNVVFRGYRRREGGPGRYIAIEAVSRDAWLDWKVIRRWSSRTDTGGKVRKISSDKQMILQLLELAGKDGGTPISADPTYIDETRSAGGGNPMDPITVTGVTLREAIERVADAATAVSDTPTRHFYIDAAGLPHYYKDAEGLTAPYRIADGSYTADIRTDTPVSCWLFREPAGTTVYDLMGYADGTLSGGYTRLQTGGIVNEPQYGATKLNGTTGYMTASGANLHPGNTFSIEFWIKRGTTTGTIQTIVSGGTDDYEVLLTAADKFALSKEGTGTIWVGDTAYTSSVWRHIVLTKSGSTRKLYVDGVEDAAASGANATIVAAAGAVNVGRRLSSTDRFLDATVQHVAVYSSALSAATVLAHYRQGISLTPEDLVVEREARDGREMVWVRGASKATDPGLDGTGFVYVSDAGDFSIAWDAGGPGGGPWRAEVISRPDSNTAAKRKRYGAAFLRRNRSPSESIRFRIVGYDGWRVGQTVYFTDDAMELSNYGADIVLLETDVGLGTGVLTYDITCGVLPITMVRRLGRSIKRNR